MFVKSTVVFLLLSKKFSDDSIWTFEGKMCFFFFKLSSLLSSMNAPVVGQSMIKGLITEARHSQLDFN